MTSPSELKNSLRPLSFFSKSLVVLLCCFLRSIAATWTAGRWGRTLWTPSPLDSLCGWCKRRAAQRVVCHDRAKKCFYIPEDREVIVYFEWEGPKGNHHCEGMVKGPSGQFATMTSFEYATQPRFAGYWKMPLSDSSPTGNWIFESHVDGELAGQATFQVVSNTKPADLPKAAVLPTAAEIYKLGVAASVSIDKRDATGKSLRRASGFLTPLGVVTSFRAIEGANNLALVFRRKRISHRPDTRME
jgi:hypothetical protein